jgi:hypothetical protein
MLIKENYDNNKKISKSNICDEKKCQNNGECIELNSVSSSCLCNLPFYGENCQFEDLCYNSPCKNVNEQLCYQLPNNSFTCINTNNNKLNEMKTKINENIKNLTINNRHLYTFTKKLDFNLTCPKNYCNSNGICVLNVYENLLKCTCFNSKTGPNCDIGKKK